MKCPRWAYEWTMKATSDKGPKHDDLCPCCTTTWLTDLIKLAWYTLARIECPQRALIERKTKL